MTGGHRHRALAGLALIACLGSCTQPGPSRQERAAALRALNLPPAANPSEVVATEVAFARLAREEGQWTAFRQYAAPGALIHGQRGPIEALPWLAGQADPPASVQWAPREVWSSCDGGTVVSFGRFADPAGQHGYFVTVWERQADDSYRYVYDFGWPDAELTRAEQAKIAAGEGPADGILVEAYSYIQGRVADCRVEGGKPEYAASIVAQGVTSQQNVSRDRTLAWRWEQHPDGTRRFVADWLHEGAWTSAIDRTIAPAAAPTPTPAGE